MTQEQNELVQSVVSSIRQIAHTTNSLSSDEDKLVLKRAIEQLQSLFLLVTVGEYNSGKSTFLNALLGSNFLAEGVTPTTDKVNIISYGDTYSSTPDHTDDDIVNIKVPVNWLKDIRVVDTPGTNAIIRSHESITSQFIPRSDFVLFVTAANQPLSNSEREFLSRIQDWKKKVVLVLSKVDILEQLDQPGAGTKKLDEIKNFVESALIEKFHEKFLIFPTSPKRRLLSLIDPENSSKYQGELGDGFDELETYLHTNLTSKARFCVKVESTASVATTLIEKYDQMLIEARNLLQSDQDAIKEIEVEIDAHFKQVEKELKLQTKQIVNLFLGMKDRGIDFFEEKVAVTNVFSLLSEEKMRKDFESQVIGDFDSKLKLAISDIVDWFLLKDDQIWQKMTWILNQRATSTALSASQPIQNKFSFDRKSLFSDMVGGVEEQTKLENREKSVQQMGSEIRNSVIQTFVAQGTAIGLTALLGVSVLHAPAIPAVAAVGFGLIPYKRHTLRKTFVNNIERIKKETEEEVSRKMELLATKQKEGLSMALFPYQQYVKKETTDLNKKNSELHSSRDNLNSALSSLDRWRN
eukprot:CAMPEP_0201515640 /NCGR_PEP_ID=MMETSP0161_2-20130828/7146_1 /ASSEMBLY_ACC=CAM_ASM_000251 /TAXON_ID=180227 /ORGANISM="Neoparamoeba aestuarina, Strain SoJaBio B1-5/56/2" /LENGTH=579 /DNA_ID=CAMNT_0047912515 /DNA_START=211 /DNA_END=1950 /DNA_ORIENTATION=-